MRTECILPETLAPAELDSLLSRGWYRMGPAVFTCSFLIFDAKLCSAVWTRLPLDGWTPRRSLRRVSRRNSERFEVVIRRPVLDDVKEEVYQRYREGFRGSIAATTVDHLHAGLEHDVFDTREIAIYDGDRLVAFSFFDLGATSIASILGVYDPDYARYSLGFWTMLLEIEYGQEHGYEYFYPGYVVPGYAPLDYKLRVGGDIEFLSAGLGAWLSIDQLDVSELPAEATLGRLDQLREALDARSLAYQSTLYPPYEMAAISGFDRCLPYPQFLTCGNSIHGALVAAWDVERDAYVLAAVRTEGELVLPQDPEAEPWKASDDLAVQMEILRLDRQLLTTRSATALAEAIGNYAKPTL